MDFRVFSETSPNYAALPGYAEYPPSVEAILNTLKDANNYVDNTISSDAPRSAFNVLRNRHHHLWIDNNHRLPRATKDSIILVATLLLCLGKAYDCNMEIFFTGFSNQDSKKLSQSKKSRAKTLELLWKTENWDDAVRLIGENAELRHPDLELDQWLIQGQVGSHYAASTNATERLKDDEKHALLLAHVRELKTLYWAGWHQRDLNPEDLKGLYTKSVAAARQQPKNLNNAYFTIKREIALQRRLYEMHNAEPTTVLLLLGSPLLDSEREAIKRDQSRVTGGGAEFSIETLLFREYLEDRTCKNHARIDDSAGGDRDIYDVTELREPNLLTSLLSAKTWLKILNSHERSIDSLKFKKEEDKYGARKINVPGQSITLPSVSQMMKELGIEDDY